MDATFTLPQDRTLITHEPPQAGTHPVPEHQDQDWLDFKNQGGGFVPEDFRWLSNPKEEQEAVSSG